MSENTYRCKATCLRESEKAVLVRIEGEELWIPKSQIRDDSEVYQKDDEGFLVMSEWIAEQKGLL